MKKFVSVFTQKCEVFLTDIISVLFFILLNPYLQATNHMSGPGGRYYMPLWLKLTLLAVLLVLQLIPIVVSLRDAFGKWPEYRTQEETKQCELRERAARRQIKGHALSSVFVIIIMYCQFNVHSPFFGF